MHLNQQQAGNTATSTENQLCAWKDGPASSRSPKRNHSISCYPNLRVVAGTLRSLPRLGRVLSLIFVTKQLKKQLLSGLEQSGVSNPEQSEGGYPWQIIPSFYGTSAYKNKHTHRRDGYQLVCELSSLSSCLEDTLHISFPQHELLEELWMPILQVMLSCWKQTHFLSARVLQHYLSQ